MLRKKLLNEKAEATNRGEAIVAAAQAEDRELTAEEMAEMATLKSRRAAIDAQLSVIEDQREAVDVGLGSQCRQIIAHRKPPSSNRHGHQTREPQPAGYHPSRMKPGPGLRVQSGSRPHPGPMTGPETDPPRTVASGASG